MKIDDIKKVCVVGGGLMGKQIALNTAIHGYDVYIVDAIPEVVDKVSQWANEYLEGRIAKGKMTKETVDSIKARFFPVKMLEEALKDADLVIEAIIEDQKVKRELFKSINQLVRKDTIIATNSSYMFSSLFADCIDNSDRMANLHYFNPALVMKLTEVVQGSHTSQETIETLMDFSLKTGKKPVWVKKEIEGFIVNRVLRSVINEAMYLVTENIAQPQEIDTAVENGLGYPMGPFRTQDLAGLDTAYFAAKRQLEETGVKRIGYELLEEKYNSKEWGKKVGKGWYDYTK